MLAQRVFHQIAFRGKDSVSSGILHIQIANHRNESFDFFLGLLIKVAGLGFSAISQLYRLYQSISDTRWG